MKKLFTPIILLIAICLHATAQEKSHKEMQGDKFAFRYSYEKAIESYNQAKMLTIEGQRHLAEAYRKLDKNAESELVYEKLIIQSDGVLPVDYFNYAMVLKSNGRYQQSAVWMEKFVQLKPEDLRAKSFAENKTDVSNLQKDDGKYRVKHLDINTDAEDFGTSYYKNQVVFTSSRTKSGMIKRNYNWTGQPFWDLYVSDVDSGQLSKPQKFNKKTNRRFHDGPASFGSNGTVMAFSRNNYSDHTNDKVVEIQIWFCVNENSFWSQPSPFAFNNSEYSVGQPCLSNDGNTMYFTSDMPGGYGGADIYKTTKNNAGEWGKPENLGSDINSESDEMFPFFQENNQVLFFASNGRFGLGGLDIFIAEYDINHFGKIYNAGSPLNSQYDDFAIIVDDKMAKGYFSSNRVGGSGSDDIYGVDLLKTVTINKKISGIAKNSVGFPIENTFITLLNDSGMVLDTVTTQKDAAFSFMVKKDNNYLLKATNKDYLNGDTIANTFGKEVVVTADIIMYKKAEYATSNVIAPVPVKETATKTISKTESKTESKVDTKTVTEKIKVGANLAKILAFDPNTIYFDYGKAAIRPDAIDDLNNIVKIMNEHPTMVVELGSHTDCRSSFTFNQKLSEQRARASTLYIQKRITNPTRISGKGYGKTKLINRCECEFKVQSDCTEAEHQKNRRTEFIIVKE